MLAARTVADVSDDSAARTARSDRELRTTRGKLRAVVVAFGLLIAGLVASVLLGVAFTVPVLFSGGDPTDPWTFLALAAVGQVAFLAVGAAYVRRYGSVRVTWPTRREWTYAVGGWVGALALVAAASVAAALAGVAPGGSVFDDPITADPRVALGVAALSILLVAPAEELLFRGAIQGRLRRSFGPVAGVGLATAVFGSIHLTNFSGSLAGVAVGTLIVTVAGGVFGVLYERTGNLAVPVFAHAAYNTTLSVITFLAA